MIRRTEDDVVTDYIYDRSGEIPKLIRAVTGGVVEDYVHASHVVSRSTDGEHHFYHADASGNVRFQTDNAAVVGSVMDYLPFGHPSSAAPDALAEGLVAFQFAGEPYDPASQLTYLRQRYYSPTLRRFISPDAYQGHESVPLTQQPYAYGMNSPLMFGDPTGEMPSLVELQVAGSIAATLGLISVIQVAAGMGGLSGGEVTFSGPLVSLGGGVNAGVGFSVDAYSGLLASDRSFVGGPNTPRVIDSPPAPALHLVQEPGFRRPLGLLPGLWKSR